MGGMYIFLPWIRPSIQQQLHHLRPHFLIFIIGIFHCFVQWCFLLQLIQRIDFEVLLVEEMIQCLIYPVLVGMPPSLVPRGGGEG